jgi:hypothetical protein
MQDSRQVQNTLLRALLHWALIPMIAVSMSLWPSLSSGLERLQFDAGDTLLNLYFLEHAFQHFTGTTTLNPDHYWSPNFFWPIKDTMSWSDHLLGQSVIYGPIRIILDPFQSYISWLGLTLWLNYISIRHACLKISPTTNSAWLSLTALVTSFSPAIMQQLSHPQLLSLFLIGPILWLCHRLIKENPEDFHIADWLTLFSWLLANAFFNIYIFVYACYGALFCVLVHIVKRIIFTNKVIQAGGQVFSRLVILVSCVAIDVAIYFPYLKTLGTFGKRPQDEIINNLPKPTSWLFGSSQWLLTPPLTPNRIDPNWISGAEQELFPGWGFLILLTGALLTAFYNRQRKDTGLGLWLIVFSLMVFGSLSITGLSLWPLISKVLPGANSLRASSRVAMVIVLYGAPAITVAATYWRFRRERALEGWAALLAMLGGFSGIWSMNPPSFSLEQWRAEQQELSQALRSSDCNLFWYEWHDQEPWRAHVVAMHAQLETGVPTANGYSGHFPKEDWPFVRPHGDNALRWITTSKPDRFHDLKPNEPNMRWCIASKPVESTDKSVSIRRYDPAKAKQYQSIWIDLPQSELARAADVAIGKKFGMLYIKSSKGNYPEKWALITRSGNGIPAKRGRYQITKIRLISDKDKAIALVTDQNFTEKTEYVWHIDAATGEFLGQTHSTIKAN